MSPMLLVLLSAAAPVGGLGLLQLQARLERWDYERHADDWSGDRATLTRCAPAALGLFCAERADSPIAHLDNCHRMSGTILSARYSWPASFGCTPSAPISPGRS